MASLSKRILSALSILSLMAGLLVIPTASAAAPVGITAPGTTSYTNAQLRAGADTTLYGENITGTGAMQVDEDAGFAYAISYISTNGILSKIRLSDKVVVKTLNLPSLDWAWSTNLSSDGEFMYIPDYCGNATSTIYKIATDDLTIADQVDIAGAPCLSVGSLDEANNVGFFVSDDSPAVVYKIDLATMDILDDLTLDAGEEWGEALYFDPATNHVHVGLYSGTTFRIVRVNAADMTRIDVTAYPQYSGLYTQLGESPIDGHMYFSLREPAPGPTTGIVVKINATTMAVADSLTLSVGDGLVNVFALDEANNRFFVHGSATSPTKYFKSITLDTLDLIQSGTTADNRGIDIEGMAYVAGSDQLITNERQNTPGIVRGIVHLRSATDFSVASTHHIPQNENWGEGMVVHEEAGFGYALMDNASLLADPDDGIVKFNLDTGERIAYLPIPAGYDINFRSEPVLDKVNNRLYVPTYNYTGASADAIQVLDLATFTVSSTFNLGGLSTTRDMSAGVVDSTGSFMYFGTRGDGVTANTIGRMNLSSLTSTCGPSLNTRYQDTRSVAIDETTGYGYYVMNDTTLGQYIIRRNDCNNNTSLITDVYTFAAGEVPGEGMAIDTTRGKLYVGLVNGSFKIRKIDLATMTTEATLTDVAELYPESLDIDVTNNIGYAATLDTPSKIVKFDLGTMTTLGKITLGVNDVTGLDLDLTRGKAYAISNTSPAHIVTTEVSHKGSIYGTKVTLAGAATDIQQVRMYSHAAQGNLRLGILDASYNKVWESGVIANTTAGDWVRANISAGTPSSLANLPAGDYWLTFQTDSNANIASFSTGGAGTGLQFHQTFGALPNTLTAPTLSTENYAMHLGYGAGFTATETGGSTNITEGGATDTYSIVLQNAPTDTVTVNLSIGGSVNLSTNSFVFTTLNWNVPQTVTLSIADDSTAASNRIETLTHSIVSTLPEYTLDGIAPVSVYVSDASSLPPAGSIVGNTSLGSTTYPDGGMIRLDQASDLGQTQHDSGVLDPATGTLFYGGSQPSIMLVDSSNLEHLKDLPTRGNSYLEYDFEAADIDTTNGFAYFASNTSPVKLAKIRMADKKIVSILNLGAGDNGAVGVAVDAPNDAVYVATTTSPTRIVKVRLSTFTRVSHVTLPDSTSGAGDMIIDSTSQTLYIGSNNASTKVYKVNTATMAYVGNILVPGLDDVAVAPKEIYNGYAYILGHVGTQPSLARIQLSDFSLQGTVTAAGLPDYCARARMDTANGFIYCSGWVDYIARFDLNAMSYVDNVAVPAGGNYAFLYDQANNMAYVSIDTTPVKVSKVDLDTNTVLSTKTYPEVANNPTHIAHDPDGSSFFYITGSGVDTRMIRADKDTMMQTGYFSHTSSLTSIVYDPTRDVIYAGVDRSGATPDELIRIDASTLAITGTISLLASRVPDFGVVSTDGNFGYFILDATSTNAYHVQKVDLNTFTVDGASVATTLNNQNPRNVFYDEDSEVLVIQNQRTIAPTGIRITNFHTDTMTEGTNLQLGTSSYILLGVDAANDDVYIANNTLLRIERYNRTTWALEDDLPYTIADHVGTNLNGYPVDGGLYIGFNRVATGWSKGYVSRLDLNTFTISGTTGLVDTEIYFEDAVIDTTRGSIYAAMSGTQPIVSRIAMGHEGAIWGSKVTLTEASNNIDSIRFYAHNADGNLRVALYDADRDLVWESGSFAMSTDNTWYNVAVSSGTPNSLSGLAPGNYYIVFQSDSFLMTPGYTAGNAGDGLFLPQTYGAFPTDLDIADSNARQYSVALTVNVGLSLTESAAATSIVEGGASDSYDIVLNSQPASDVTFNINNPGGLTLSTTSVTFTSSNWNVPQTVTVSLADTGTSEGTRNLTLSHSIVSTDPYYFSQTLRDVVVSVSDPAAAPVAAPVSTFGGGGGGFSSAPNTLGDYIAQNPVAPDATTPDATTPDSPDSDGISVPVIDLGTPTDGGSSSGGDGGSGTGVPTRPSAPGSIGSEPAISLCEIQRLNLTRGTIISYEDIKESDFRTLVRDYGLVLTEENDPTNPYRHITRSEILRLILQTQCGAFDIPKAKDAPFPDVSRLHKDAIYVAVAKLQDIVSGYLSDGTYKPDNDISRAEALKIVLEVVFRKQYEVIKGNDQKSPRDIARDAWYYRYANFATERGIIGTEDFRPNDKATREDIATFLLESVRIMSLVSQS